jgi:ATP-binding cassette subfamily B protein
MRQLLNSGSRWVEYDLRNDLFRQLTRLSPEFYDRASTGDLMARSTNDLTAARMAAGPALMYMVDTAVRIVIVAPAMLAISPKLTVLALLPLLGLPVVMVSLGQMIHYRSLAIQSSGSDEPRARESVDADRAATGRIRGNRPLPSLNDEYLTRNVALAGRRARSIPCWRCWAAWRVAVLFIGGRLVIAGTVSVGGSWRSACTS